ncbi:MAG: CvpA family protein, partial [Planctomycetota bacterium]
MFDLILMAMVLLAILRGYMRGALQQVLQVAALLAAYPASIPAGALIRPILMRSAGWSVGFSYCVGRVAGGLVVYLILTVALGVVDRRFLRPKLDRFHGWNRVLGAPLGLAWGLLVFFVVVFLADVAVKILPAASGRIPSSVRESVFRRWASSFNPADRFLVTDVLRAVRAARRDPALRERLAQNEEVRKVLDHPDFQALLEDEELVAALRN